MYLGARVNFSIYKGTIGIGVIGEPESYQDYEDFTMTENPDRSRTLRTLSRAPRGDLLRDVNQMAGPDFRPIEAMGRLFFKGEALGTIMRRVIDDTLYSYAWRPGGPMDTAEFHAPPRMTIGYHPIMHEAWKMNFHDREKGGVQDAVIFTVSKSWNGKSLGHGELLTSKAEFLGYETIKVPAGEFDCESYIWWTNFDLEIKIWRTKGTNLTTKMEVRGGEKNRNTMYQMIKYSETNVEAEAD